MNIRSLAVSAVGLLCAKVGRLCAVVVGRLVPGRAALPTGEPTSAREAAAQRQEALGYDREGDARIKARMSEEELAWEQVLEAHLGPYYLTAYKNRKAQGKETAFDYVQDDPRLPRVLIIGDSISRGYTLPVRHLLAGKANVHRAPANCGSTANGVKDLDAWLGKRKWSLIVFNFSIHDRVTPARKYATRLDFITRRLKATGAQVVWVSGTPLPDSEKDEKKMVRLNTLAAKVMQRHGVPTIDAYALVIAHPDDLRQPDGVHLTAQGYDALGHLVSDGILRYLGKVA